MRQGLVAEYCFAGNADDTSGAGHHGIVHGATLCADRFGHPGHAYRFDGQNDYIEVNPPPLFPASSMSVSVWFLAEPRDLAGWTNCIVAQDDGNDEDQKNRVFQLSADRGHIVWHRMIGARDPVWHRRMPFGRWVHVVGVHDHGVNRLYIDGALQDEVTHKLWTSATQPLNIGRKGTPEPYFFFKGSIDDLRIYDRALSGADVSELLSEGKWNPEPPAGLPFTGDPLSGHWGQDGVVFLDLRYDGGSRVTGRIMAGRPSNPSDIVSGSFDRATGRLVLEGTATDPRDGTHVVWNISGLVADGEVAVTARFNTYQGDFFLTRAGTRPRATPRSIRSHLGALAYRVREFVSRA